MTWGETMKLKIMQAGLTLAGFANYAHITPQYASMLFARNLKKVTQVYYSEVVDNYIKDCGTQHNGK